MPNDELEAPAGERARLFASAEAVSTQEMLALLDQVGLPATEMLAFFDQAGFPATSPEASSEPQRSSEFEARAASEDQGDLSVTASEAHKPQRSSDQGQAASDSESQAASEGAVQQASPTASAETPCEPRTLSGPRSEAVSEGARQQGSLREKRMRMPRTFLPITSGRLAVRIAAVGTLVSVVGLAGWAANHGRTTHPEPMPTEVASVVEPTSEPATVGRPAPETDGPGSAGFRGSADVVQQASAPATHESTGVEQASEPAAPTGNSSETDSSASSNSLALRGSTGVAGQVSTLASDGSTHPEPERSKPPGSPEYRDARVMPPPAAASKRDKSASSPVVSNLRTRKGVHRRAAIPRSASKPRVRTPIQKSVARADPGFWDSLTGGITKVITSVTPPSLLGPHQGPASGSLRRHKPPRA